MEESTLDKKNKSASTRLIHGKTVDPSWDFSKHLVPPITSSTTYRLESTERGHEGFKEFLNPHSDKPIWVYDRLDEPNCMMLENQMADFCNGEVGVAFSSGMSAISSLFLALLKQGDTVLAHRTVYGCTHNLFQNWMSRLGIKVIWTNLLDLPLLSSLLKEHTPKLVYMESLTNPTLELLPLKKIVATIESYNKDTNSEVVSAVDNTFLTPHILKPLNMGIDFEIHSLTKSLSGFGTEMGGMVVCSKKHEISLKLVRKDFGGVLHPSSAWSILQHGLSTLEIRLKKQQESAAKIASFLEGHPKIGKVIYPGLESYEQKDLATELLTSETHGFQPGFLISFELKSSADKSDTFLNLIAKNSYSITLAVSLGLTRTLIQMPSLMTHCTLDADDQASSGISRKLIRLSVGLEDPQDIINDLKSNLEQTV